MSDRVKRINPRRPWLLSVDGIKRIVLGVPGSGMQQGQAAVSQHSAAKPLRTPANPTSWVLVIAHSDRGMLDDHARQAIAAAAILADTSTAVAVLVMGDLHENLADAGADRVIVMPELDIQRFQPDVELACVAETMTRLQPQRIYLPDNLSGDGDLGRRLIASQRMQKTSATHVTEITADHVAVYQAGGSALAVGSLPDIVLLAKDVVDARLPFTAGAQRHERLHGNTTGASSRYADLGMNEIDAAQIALEEADFIVSAGNGVHNVATLEALACSLNAAVGASRVAVDDGKFSRDKQIGATGKTVSASAYLAIGISGAVQHLQGIKDCRHVIAINRDGSAPIVKRANLSVVGDAEDIMQSLNQAIAQAKTPSATREAA